MCICICMYMCVHMCICVYVYVMHAYVYMYISTYIQYMYISTYIHGSKYNMHVTVYNIIPTFLTALEHVKSLKRRISLGARRIYLIATRERYLSPSWGP